MAKINLLKNNEDIETVTENDKFFLINKFKEYVRSKSIRIDTNDLENVDLKQFIGYCHGILQLLTNKH